jgi:dihydrolipoamide dehydrogenase
MDVVLVSADPEPGGVCLYRGCIPSKSLLHAAQVIRAAEGAGEMGITFGEPKVDLDKLRGWKQSIVDKLTSGLAQLTKQRGIKYLEGRASFTDSGELEVALADGGTETIEYENAILATGSEPVHLDMLPESPLIMDSTEALALTDIPKSMLVMGGGYIGVELGQAYAAYGVEVSCVEMQASLLPGVDRELVKPLAKCLSNEFHEIFLGTRVVSAELLDDGVKVNMESQDGTKLEKTYSKVLVAVGRRPVSKDLGLDNVGVDLDDHGFVKVDQQRFTSNRAIQAVGDIAGQPMLAHKATHEGRSAVEALNDEKTIYDPRAIPAVVFTDPEIAWCGLTEDEARRQGLSIKMGVFPWQASGRAATLAKTDGITKIVSEAESGLVLGVGVTGHSAGELIGEGVLAIEMGAVAEDIALTIHAHPSLSETLMEAAERIIGQSTHFFQRM